MEDVTHPAADDVQGEPAAATKRESAPFVGRWNLLVSTTNWEKGRIIHEWRQALQASGAAATGYSDEAWSRLVTCITAQHVGRLRRVWQRFGGVCQQYEGLYWSHFQAAVEWDDAEMYLEGAVQNKWSVSQMRRTRWEAMGRLEADRPGDADTPAELDEDFEPAGTETPDSGVISPSYDHVGEPPLPEGPDFGEEEEATTSDAAGRVSSEDAATGSPVTAVRPFEDLGELPEDVSEAFEAFKLAILRHKADGWRQITLEEMLGSLDALKELALAPSVDGG